MLWSIVVAGVPLAGFGQARQGPTILPVPYDPLELATGPIQAAGTPASRDAALLLLARARENLAMKTGQSPYHLKVTFTADSRGQTSYDGAWEMDDVFVPGQGLRWAAKGAAGYATTRIMSAGGVYGEGTANVIPLRLHEARGLLIDPIQSPEYAERGSIRTATASFRGAEVVCILLAHSHKAAIPAVGRAWEESEECIDPTSGLLQLHSEAPGRYAVYDYSEPQQLGGYVLPKTVTVTEAGRVVSKISVESLEPTEAESSQFAPTDAMRAGGPAIAIKGAIRVSRQHGPRSVTPAMTLRAVCVFGVVTPSGQLVEAHSLQPSDPNSDAAVADAKTINFSPFMPAGGPPQQHFAFVIEKFVSRH